MKNIIRMSSAGFLLAIVVLDSLCVEAAESGTPDQKSAVSYVSTFEDPTSKTQLDTLLSDTLTDSLNSTFYASVPALSPNWGESESSTTIDHQNIIVGENGSLQKEPMTLMDYRLDTKNKSFQDQTSNNKTTVSYVKDTSASAKDKDGNQKALQLL